MGDCQHWHDPPECLEQTLLDPNMAFSLSDSQVSETIHVLNETKISETSETDTSDRCQKSSPSQSTQSNRLESVE